MTLAGTGFAQGKAGGGGGGGGANGGGGGGGGVKPAPTPIPVVLPSTPPAPDVIMRESFGMGDDLLRPTGGKGELKATFTHTSISGFWVEYPGSKDAAWLAPPETGQTWRICASSPDPYEMFSPLQVANGNGCLASEWFDAVPENPTALMPFKAPASAYEISINGYPAPIEGKYIALGLTNSSLLSSNLETSASVWLVLRPGPAHNNTTVIYELRASGTDGPVLASGETYFDPFNRLVLRYDPLAKLVSASVNEIELGSFSQSIPTPKFIGIEGVGIVDNLVVRKLP
ncbi:MAG TPA: hypothetical protein VLJ61_01310 [Pyrinomonadaceae bacterium]|nr:hypothetical protein [Pyrinomonadaceae bacterium]